MRNTVLLLAVLTTACTPQVAPLPPGKYCHVEELTADAGKGKSFSMGQYWAVVNVEQRGRDVHVEYDNVMPDSSQRLMLEGQARPQRDGSVEFTFTDNWENLGTAKLTRDGLISFSKLKGASDPRGRNALRNYRDDRVTREACIKHGFQNWHRPR